MDKLDLKWNDLFLKQEDLINKKTKILSEIDIDLSMLKKQLQSQFAILHDMTTKTDASFSGAVKAQEIKQLKGLENLEKRLLKAQKIKLKDTLDRIIDLQNELFPNHGLQERQANFSEFYLECGDDLIPMLMENLKPLEQYFNNIKL